MYISIELTYILHATIMQYSDSIDDDNFHLELSKSSGDLSRSSSFKKTNNSLQNLSPYLLTAYSSHKNVFYDYRIACATQ